MASWADMALKGRNNVAPKTEQDLIAMDLEKWAANPNKKVMELGDNSWDGGMGGQSSMPVQAQTKAPAPVPQESGIDWSAMASKYGPAALQGLNMATQGALANQADYAQNMSAHENLKNKALLAQAGIADRMAETSPVTQARLWSTLSSQARGLDTVLDDLRRDKLLEELQNKKEAEKVQAVQEQRLETAKESEIPAVPPVKPPTVKKKEKPKKSSAIENVMFRPGSR